MVRPENYDPNKLYVIPNLEDTAQLLRKEGIKEFNLRYADDCMKLDAGVYKNGRHKRWTKTSLEEVFPLARVKEIMKETLPFIQEEEKYCINAKFFAQTIEKVARNIFYHTCNKLVDDGIMELIFCEENKNFGYRFIKDPGDEYLF
jgi:hypothetical protein